MLDYVHRHTIPAAYAILPAAMASPDATRMLLAIGLQESHFAARAQHGGPARGFWQFEASGITGLQSHPATRTHLANALTDLCYDLEHQRTTEALLVAIEHNDVLACVLARLNIWWLPEPLAIDADNGWAQYLAAWRPGRPRAETWATNWADAGLPR